MKLGGGKKKSKLENVTKKQMTSNICIFKDDANILTFTDLLDASSYGLSFTNQSWAYKFRVLLHVM